jgi:Bacterial capsule synthesis protein PGA_cap
MKILTLTAIFLCGVFIMTVSASESITISAVGDIMMGTTHPRRILPPDDGRGIFSGVARQFEGCDIVFGNLEGPLLDEGKTDKCDGQPEGHCYAFKTPTRYVKYLKDSGFNVVNIANNHSLDFDEDGIQSTIRTLRVNNILAVGGESVARLTVKGKRVAIAGFSFSSSPYSFSILDLPAAMGIVRRLKEKNDIVIVSFHGGAEGASALHIPDGNETFLGEDRGDVKKFSRSVIDAGADLVIGHGPHVMRAMEIYKGKLIAYSLGNFLTYGVFNLKKPSGLSAILRVRIDAESGNLLDGELIPVKLVRRGIPVMDPAREAIGLVRKITGKDIRRTKPPLAESGKLTPGAGEVAKRKAGRSRKS